MDKELLSKLGENRIFSSLTPEQLLQIIGDCGRFTKVRRGRALPWRCPGECAFIMSGTAVIYTDISGMRTILRFAGPVEAVGVAGMFSENAIPTRIEACSEKELTAIIFTLEEFRRIMTRDTGGTIRDNLLLFLSKKVAFLNARLNTVTGGNAEQRLASYILASAGEDGLFDPGMSMKDLASCLNIGRASLYRAADNLSLKEGAKYNDGTFRIINRETLTAISCGQKD